MPSTTTTTTTSFYFILSVLILSFASTPLSCASNPSRRILHQPFPVVPLDTFPPSQPPSPSPTTATSSTLYKFPFSSSTPPDTPFFPTYPSHPPPPPPPPSPIAFASFPANISSLALPHSPTPHSSSSKLVAVTAAAAISAIVVVAIVVFYYRSRRFQNRKYADEDKTDRSSGDNTRRYSTNAETRSSTAPKLRIRSTSSDFLYLGTLVDSTGISDSSNIVVDTRKLDSPELRPLPPLNKQGFRHNWRTGEGGSTTGEDEEEFYSATGSLGGRDSSSGAGSGTRRVFTDVVGADFGRSIDSSSCSCSSSSTGSPSRANSISPPVSLSPHLKSLENVAVVNPTPPPPPPPPPFRLHHGVACNGERSSPSLSIASSPDRAPGGNTHSSGRPSDVLDQNPGSDSLASPRFSNVSNQNVRSPSLSPERIDNELQRNMQSLSVSSASTSPNRSLAASPRLSNDFDPNVRSPSLSSASTSPGPRLSNTSLPSTSYSSSPELGVKKSLALNVKISSALELPNSLLTPPPPPLPPPPPPPPPPQRPWESRVETTPTGQLISRPPSLIPPSTPFVLQSTNKISQVELPPSSKAVEENLEETSKPKLKPLHWDKVRASSDREMVWDHLRSSSFK